MRQSRLLHELWVDLVSWVDLYFCLVAEGGLRRVEKLDGALEVNGAGGLGCLKQGLSYEGRMDGKREKLISACGGM